jgi:RNA polymerase sigma factor (sigma-70 family)
MDARDRRKLTDDLARLADGDRGAFDAVFSRLLPCVRAFCEKTLTAADAEDAAQLAMEKVFSRACGFDRDRDALTWALSIAAWEVRTICTRRRRARIADVDAEPIDNATPEHEAMRRELENALADVLGTLSPNDRETLAAVLDDRGEGPTFRKRKERALTRLREAWRKLYGPA